MRPICNSLGLVRTLYRLHPSTNSRVDWTDLLIPLVPKPKKAFHHFPFVECCASCIYVVNHIIIVFPHPPGFSSASSLSLSLRDNVVEHGNPLWRHSAKHFFSSSSDWMALCVTVAAATWRYVCIYGEERVGRCWRGPSYVERIIASEPGKSRSIPFVCVVLVHTESNHSSSWAGTI